MNLVLFSWNGFNINDWYWNGTGIGEWSSELPVGQRASLNASAIYSPIAYSFPKLSTAQYDGHSIAVTFHPKSKTNSLAVLREQLKQWLQMGKDFSTHQLIAKDIEDSNRQWYLNAIPVGLGQTNIAEFVVVFALGDPIWREVTASTTGDLNANANPFAIGPLTIRGNVPAQPIITIKPTSGKSGSFLYKRYIKLYNSTTKPFPFSVSTVDVTNGGLDTAALILAGKMLASGNDCRVFVDGVDSNRWFGTGGHAINTATTFIFANIPHSRGQVGTLDTALPNNGTTVDVVFQQTAANLKMLTAMKTVINRAFIIDSEIFTFSKANVDVVNYTIKSCKRAQKTTSFAAHSTAASITWIEHDVWLVYGQATATAPDIDDTQKPMMDLATTTNTSWVWSQFFDSSSVRPGEWRPELLASSINKLTGKRLTNVYTGNQLAFANPSTELGLQMRTSIINNIVKAETALLQWSFYHPAGFTTTSMAGSKYLVNLSRWPATAGMLVTNDKVDFTTVWNEAAPGVASTWTAFTHNAVALGATFLYVILQLQGSIAAISGNIGAIQGDTVTLALGTGRLTVVMLAEISNYHATITITNSTSGESIYIRAAIQGNQTITIDCAAKTVTLDDGTNLFQTLSLSPDRINPDWFNLGYDTNGKWVGTATLSYKEPGIVAETVNISWNSSAE